MRQWFKQQAHKEDSKGKTKSDVDLRGVVEDDLLEAMKLAWELHRGNVSHTKVGERGQLDWFR